jgi:hypothetical protein
VRSSRRLPLLGRAHPTSPWVRRPSQATSPPGVAMTSRLQQLSALGQSVWIDYLSRDLIGSGTLAKAIADMSSSVIPHHRPFRQVRPHSTCNLCGTWPGERLPSGVRSRRARTRDGRELLPLQEEHLHAPLLLRRGAGGADQDEECCERCRADQNRFHRLRLEGEEARLDAPSAEAGRSCREAGVFKRSDAVSGRRGSLSW